MSWVGAISDNDDNLRRSRAKLAMKLSPSLGPMTPGFANCAVQDWLREDYRRVYGTDANLFENIRLERRDLVSKLPALNQTMKEAASWLLPT